MTKIWSVQKCQKNWALNNFEPYILYIYTHTLPETNVAPENGWLEDYFPIGEAYFQGRTVSFREGIYPFLFGSFRVPNLQQNLNKHGGESASYRFHRFGRLDLAAGGPPTEVRHDLHGLRGGPRLFNWRPYICEASTLSSKNWMSLPHLSEGKWNAWMNHEAQIQGNLFKTNVLLNSEFLESVGELEKIM